MTYRAYMGEMAWSVVYALSGVKTAHLSDIMRPKEREKRTGREIADGINGMLEALGGDNE